MSSYRTTFCANLFSAHTNLLLHCPSVRLRVERIFDQAICDDAFNDCYTRRTRIFGWYLVTRELVVTLSSRCNRKSRLIACLEYGVTVDCLPNFFVRRPNISALIWSCTAVGDFLTLSDKQPTFAQAMKFTNDYDLLCRQFISS